MSIYNVVGAAAVLDHWKVQGYPTGKTACCIESKLTPSKAEAERWAAAINAGEKCPEAGWAMYADD